MKFIDTHCHPYLNKEKDVDEIISNFFSNGGDSLVLISSNLGAIRENLEISKKHKNIYVVIGVHPCDVYDLNLNETIEFLEKTYSENKEKIVGIGECGLDYYWLYKDSQIDSSPNQMGDEQREILETKKQKQKIFFIAQIKLAKKLGLPLIIHNRDSKDDIFEILEQENFKNFIFHCYSEDLDFANKLLQFAPNCKISFSGIITFKNAQKVQETAKNIPLKNILAETDSPYLTPVPFRGKQENEPSFTKFVVEKIAELREENLEEVAEQIFENSKEVFKI